MRSAMQFPSHACTLLAFLLVFVVNSVTPSPFDPHLPSFSASWTEGWYFRVTTDIENSDVGAPESIGMILGDTPRAVQSWNSSVLMILIESGGKHSDEPLQVLQKTNLEVKVRYRGRELDSNPSTDTMPDFEVTADDSSIKFSGDECSLVAQIDNILLHIKCVGSPVPYGRAYESPEGIFSDLPTGLTGLHWFVESLRTPVEYFITNHKNHNAHYSGKGWMHAEKNWGESFPRQWIWAQGSSRQKTNSKNSSFVLAGGAPPSLLPSPEIWLSSIHINHLKWRFHPWDVTLFSVESHPCADSHKPNPQASLHFKAFQPLTGREAHIHIKAPLSSFYENLLCPTKHGFQPMSRHSYRAVATLQLYTRGHVLIHSENIDEGVALEFGGEAFKCAPASKSSASSLS